jgi:hypothetical protein
MKNLSNILLNFVSTKGKYDEHSIIEARLASGSNRAVAERLGIPRRTVDRAVNRVIKRAEKAGETSTVEAPKILILDIETAPMEGYLWSLWKPVFGTNMLKRTSYVLSWAAKWVGEDKVMADGICYNDDYSAGDEDDRRMLEGIWNLLDEADFVVAHNGDRFDIKKLNTAFMLAKLPPYSPIRSIDTLKMVKRCFSFDSNKLDHLLKEMYGLGKSDDGGFETWRGCMHGDMDKWDKLIQYNKDDVTKLEQLYLDIRMWDKQHPSAATHGGSTGKAVCTTCASENVVPLYDEDGDRKTVGTGVSKFPLYICEDCGTHMRSRFSVLSTEQRKEIFVRAR